MENDGNGRSGQDAKSPHVASHRRGPLPNFGIKGMLVFLKGFETQCLVISPMETRIQC